MCQPERNKALGKTVNLVMLFKFVPVNPTGFIVLTVGVVVAPCVRRNSSPPNNIGTPREISRVSRSS